MDEDVRRPSHLAHAKHKAPPRSSPPRPRQGLEIGLSPACREGEAPAEPRAKGDVNSQSRLSKSLALPRVVDPNSKT